MSLLPPYTPKLWTAIISVGTGLILLGLVLFGINKCNTKLEDRAIAKQKQAIANKQAEIANVSNQISNLEQQKAEKVGEIKVDTETLTNSIAVHEDVRKETNQAVANYQKAVATNTNVDVTAQDLQRVLNKIEDQ